MPRRIPIYLIVAALVGLLLFKSVFIWIGSSSLAHYKSLAKDHFQPVGSLDASTRAGFLVRSVRCSPSDDDAWYELARYAHRLSGEEDPEIASGAEKILATAIPQKVLNENAEADRKTALLRIAVYAYERSAASNALQAGARFWKVLAAAALDRQTGETRPEDIAMAFADLDSALAKDPMRPDRLKAAADFALSAGDLDKTIEYDRRALRLSLEEMNEAVTSLIYSPAGIEAAVSIVPQTALAQERLASLLFDKWRFLEAEEAWVRYRNLAKLPIEKPGEGSLVANGDFLYQIGSSFHDWTIQGVSGARVLRRAENGRSWLRVELSRTPANYFHVYQDLPVEPGGRYRLEALLAAQEFEPGTVVGIEAVHPLDPGLFSAGDECAMQVSNPLVGMKACGQGFMQLGTEFTVPDTLPVIRIRLRRHSADEAKSQNGILELTGVTLRPIAPAPIQQPGQE